MRNWRPIDPPKDFDPRLHEILKRLNTFMAQAQVGFAKLDRGTTTDGSSSPIAVTDHGELEGLEDDDHTQYALLAGRSGGQTLLGDPATSATDTSPDLVLANFNLAGASGAQRIKLEGGGSGGRIVIETTTLQVYARGGTTGFEVTPSATGANVTNNGSVSLVGISGSNPVLLVNHATAATAAHTMQLKARTSQTGRLLQNLSSGSSELSYIRASDGAWVGPIAAATSDTHPDDIFRIIGSVDATKQVAFEVDGLTTATTRTLTVPDVDATLILTTSINGQRIGSAVGTGNSDDLFCSGRLHLGTAVANTNCFLNVAKSLTTSALTNFVRIFPSIGVTTSSNATYRGILVQISGGSGITSGNPNFTGARYEVTPNYLLGLGTVVGMEQIVTVPLGNQSLTRLLGSSSTLTGSTGYTGTQDVTSASMALLTFTLNRSNYGTLRLFELSSTASSIYGVTAAARLFDFEQAFDTGSFGSGTMTGTLTNGSTNITAVDGASLNNLRVGMLVGHANIPVGTYISLIDIGAATVSMTQAATGSAAGASITYSGAITVLSGMYKVSNYPANVRTARILDLQSEDYSQMYGKFYLRPPTPSGYPVPTAYLHIGAGTAAAATAPIKLTSGTSMTTAEAGAIELTTDDLFFTITTGPARKRLLMADPTGGLTSGRVPFSTTNGRLTDLASFTINSGTGLVTVASLVSSALTSGRVVIAGASGLLTDDADITFSVDTLTVTKIAATTLTGLLTFADAIDIAFNTTTGTKIGTAASQKLAFWNATPIVQPTTAVAAATFVANTSGIVDDSATFDGYTIGQVVKALRNTGLLA